jgi:uncharacterized protein YyaL (SSP411 family)
LVDAMRNYHIPGFIAVHIKPGASQDCVLRRSAHELKMIKNLPTAYICHNKICHMPVTDPKVLTAELHAKYVFKCDSK